MTLNRKGSQVSRPTAQQIMHSRNYSLTYTHPDSCIMAEDKSALTLAPRKMKVRFRYFRKMTHA
jgi:hypothetical protein